jgi:adenylyltransferase/sulfurtransferase
VRRLNTVLVIGAGGLGCPFYNISRRRGELLNYRFDPVDSTYNKFYIPKTKWITKATTAKSPRKKLNPLIKVIAFEEKLTIENAVSFQNLTS